MFENNDEASTSFLLCQLLSKAIVSTIAFGNFEAIEENAIHSVCVISLATLSGIGEAHPPNFRG